MYRATLPSIDDIVIAQIASLTEMGAYVSLLEYGSLEGFIPAKELSKSRAAARSIKVQQTIVAQVISVNVAKKYVDLSRKRVRPEEAEATDAQWRQTKLVHSILKLIAPKLGLTIEEIYAQLYWPLSDRFGNVLEALQLALTTPEAVFSFIPFDRDIILDVLKQRLKPPSIKLRADIELTCFAREGINAIRSAIQTAECVVRLISSPLYIVELTAPEQAEGLQQLSRIVATIGEALAKQGGQMVIKQAPRVLSAEDTTRLTERLRTLEEEAHEVDGDDDDSD